MIYQDLQFVTSLESLSDLILGSQKVTLKVLVYIYIYMYILYILYIYIYVYVSFEGPIVPDLRQHLESPKGLIL